MRVSCVRENDGEYGHQRIKVAIGLGSGGETGTTGLLVSGPKRHQGSSTTRYSGPSQVFLLSDTDHSHDDASGNLFTVPVPSFGCRRNITRKSRLILIELCPLLPGQKMPTFQETIADDINAGDNVLLLCPPFVTAGPATCVDLLTVEAHAARNVLSIIYTPSPRDRFALCDQYADTRPADATIINVDVDTRSSLAPPVSDAPPETPDDLTLERVQSPTNLTSLGVKITNQLDTWTTNSPETQVVGCFHSITALLQYVTLAQTFKFLNVLTSRFADANAITHYHMDPAAHDAETISRLSRLFDSVVEYQQGEWSVSTR